MIWRTIVVWFGLLAVAIGNGAFREAAITPRFGSAAGHAISTVLLCALILVLAWATVPWIAPANAEAAWLVGLVWLLLTLAFEFLAGRYLFGKPWSELLADYNVLRGRIWPLVLVTTLIAPWLMFRLAGSR